MKIEQVKEAETPEQMRSEIFRLGDYDPLIRHVTHLANYNGLSAEDKYTMLAYVMLVNRNLYKEMVIKTVDYQLNPAVIFDAGSLVKPT